MSFACSPCARWVCCDSLSHFRWIVIFLNVDVSVWLRVGSAEVTSRVIFCGSCFLHAEIEAPYGRFEDIDFFFALHNYWLSENLNRPLYPVFSFLPNIVELPCFMQMWIKWLLQCHHLYTKRDLLHCWNHFRFKNNNDHWKEQPSYFKYDNHTLLSVVYSCVKYTNNLTEKKVFTQTCLHSWQNYIYDFNTLDSKSGLELGALHCTVLLRGNDWCPSYKKNRGVIMLLL